jgi:hypothetical protein
MATLFSAPVIKKGKYILFFYGAMLHSYRENSVALDGESRSSCQKQGSDSWVPVYQ